MPPPLPVHVRSALTSYYGGESPFVIRCGTMLSNGCFDAGVGEAALTAFYDEINYGQDHAAWTPDEATPSFTDAAEEEAAAARLCVTCPDHFVDIEVERRHTLSCNGRTWCSGHRHSPSGILIHVWKRPAGGCHDAELWAPRRVSEDAINATLALLLAPLPRPRPHPMLRLMTWQSTTLLPQPTTLDRSVVEKGLSGKWLLSEKPDGVRFRLVLHPGMQAVLEGRDGKCYEIPELRALATSSLAQQWGPGATVDGELVVTGKGDEHVFVAFEVTHLAGVDYEGYAALTDGLWALEESLMRGDPAHHWIVPKRWVSSERPDNDALLRLRDAASGGGIYHHPRCHNHVTYPIDGFVLALFDPSFTLFKFKSARSLTIDLGVDLSTGTAWHPGPGGGGGGGSEIVVVDDFAANRHDLARLKGGGGDVEVIAECRWDRHRGVWVPLFRRSDKTYPNSFHTVQSTLQALMDPYDEMSFLNDVAASYGIVTAEHGDARRKENEEELARRNRHYQQVAKAAMQETRDVCSGRHPYRGAQNDIKRRAIKRTVTNSTATGTPRVLDIGAGRGGDIYKLIYAAQQRRRSGLEAVQELMDWVAVDIAYATHGSDEPSCMQAEAQRRFDELKVDGVKATFIASDGLKLLSGPTASGLGEFTAIHCFFCLNYLTGNVGTLYALLSSFHARLADGGAVAITCTDDAGIQDFVTQHGCAPLKSEGIILSIETEQGGCPDEFQRYRFTLTDDSTSCGVLRLSEFAIPVVQIVELAQRVGFRVIFNENHGEMKRMNSAMADTVLRLYRCIVLLKVVKVDVDDDDNVDSHKRIRREQHHSGKGSKGSKGKGSKGKGKGGRGKGGRGKGKGKGGRGKGKGKGK